MIISSQKNISVLEPSSIGFVADDGGAAASFYTLKEDIHQAQTQPIRTSVRRCEEYHPYMVIFVLPRRSLQPIR